MFRSAGLAFDHEAQHVPERSGDVPMIAYCAPRGKRYQKLTWSNRTFRLCAPKPDEDGAYYAP